MSEAEDDVETVEAVEVEPVERRPHRALTDADRIERLEKALFRAALPDEATTLHNRLVASVAEATGDGHPTPCTVLPEAWLSDDPEERTIAASWCRECPLRSLCSSYAVAAHEGFGVWGGRDWTSPEKPAPAEPVHRRRRRQATPTPVEGETVEAAPVAA